MTFQTGISNDRGRVLLQDRETCPVIQGHLKQEENRIGGEQGRLQVDQRAGDIVENQKTMSSPIEMETSIVRLRRDGNSEPGEVGLDLKKRDKGPGVLSNSAQA